MRSTVQRSSLYLEAGRLSVVALVRSVVTNSMREWSKSVVRPWEALICFTEVLDWEGSLCL